MSMFHRTVADNVHSLFVWHQHKHLLDWPTCPDEPCTHLDAEFRKVWSK
jgi:hypothetical protein